MDSSGLDYKENISELSTGSMILINKSFRNKESSLMDFINPYIMISNESVNQHMVRIVNSKKFKENRYFDFNR